MRGGFRSAFEAVDEIISFVEHYRTAPATQRVCALILGDAQATVNDESLRELKAFLPRTQPVLLEHCLSLVKD